MAGGPLDWLVWASCSDEEAESLVFVAAWFFLGCQGPVDSAGSVTQESQEGASAATGPSETVLALDGSQGTESEAAEVEELAPLDPEEVAKIEEAYSACDASEGQAALDCFYHLWQTELMALRPGSASTAAALEDARHVFRRHREPALIRNPQFEDRFWSWFWGAWWKEQPRSLWRNPEGCKAFEGRAEQQECLDYSERAWDWLLGRKVEQAP